MELSYSDIRRLEKKFTKLLKQSVGVVALVREQQDLMAQRLTVIEQRISTLVTQGELLVANASDLHQNMLDLQALAAQYLDLIKAKDAANVALQAQVADLVKQVADGTLALADLQGAIDAAVADSQATEDQLRAGLPGVPPVGGTPLNPSYADSAAFSAAVTAYTGPEAVTLDGVEVKSGTAPALAYFNQTDGSVSTAAPVGPT